METKPLIRKRMIELRDRIPQEEREKRSLKVLEHLYGLPVYRNTKRILVYVNYRSEVITRYLIERAWAEGREVYVPLCHDREMVFCRLYRFDQLHPGKMGIPEPTGLPAAETQDGLVIMPGVAFDRNNHRIGGGTDRGDTGGNSRHDAFFRRRRNGGRDAGNDCRCTGSSLKKIFKEMKVS